MGKRSPMPTSRPPRRARIRCLRVGLASESGFALPATMLFIFAVLGLAGAAVLSSIASQHGTVRDQKLKTTIAAADAGSQTAIFRQNRGDSLLSTAQPCVSGGGSALTAVAKSADGWCPAVTGSVGGASWSYRVLPPAAIGGSVEVKQIQIVSTGTYSGVSRRIAVTAQEQTGNHLFQGGNFAAVGDLSATVEGNAIVNGLLSSTAIASNRDVTLRTSSADLAQLCANVQHGTGYDLKLTTGAGSVLGNQCLNPPFSFTNTSGTFPMAPVDQGTVSSSNQNANIGGSGLYVHVGTTDTVPPDSGRVLKLSGASVLTLQGGNYSLCRLEMSGSSTIIAPYKSRVNIFFDSPESCGLTDASDGVTDGKITQMKVTGASSIVSVGLLPLSSNLSSIVDPPDIGFFFLGSDDAAKSTAVDIQPTAGLGDQFVVWAPRSAVTIGGNAVYYGAFAGQTLDIKGDAVVNFDPHASNLSAKTIAIYHATRYVECTGGTSPTSSPNGAC
jgi:hypothetical protein